MVVADPGSTATVVELLAAREFGRQSSARW